MENPQYSIKEYPRPQFARDDWMNLNGIWNFEFDDANVGEKEKWYQNGKFSRKINVPFVYESTASLIGDTGMHPNVWYQRYVEIPEKYAGKHIVMNFQGVDYCAKLWVNGIYIGVHSGGNTAFQFDVTDAIHIGKDNNIVLKVEDDYNCNQPRGKQKWMDDRYLCWYVQSTGIWKTVWMEFLSDASIKNVKITPDLDNTAVDIEYDILCDAGANDLTVKTEITFCQMPIRSFSFDVRKGPMKYKTDIYSDLLTYKVMPWSPETPFLYDVKFSLYKGDTLVDEVKSYFGMRKISIRNGKVYLNNAEVYQKLILEQGYWKDTLLTPPSDEAIAKDIDMTLKMGFNGMRIHQKIEDERFLYECDKKGVLVYSEMAATYEYSDEAVGKFTQEWLEIVKQQYNHPCIITWVPFNESWGIPTIRYDKNQQNFTQSIYHLTKAMDGTRPVIANDGWEHTVSDLLTIHDYEEFADKFVKRYADKDKFVSGEVLSSSKKDAFAQGFEYSGQPILISEYGGIAFDNGKGWGYGDHVGSEEEFVKRFAAITNAIKENEYIVGYCYTQLTDVQQEINGLLTEDREPKIAVEKIAEVNRSLGFRIV